MVDDFLESKEFYYAMQGYRHSDERNQRNVWNEYENVKSLIRAKCSAGWKPIDTAPKDGVFLIAVWEGEWRNVHKSWCVYQATSRYGQVDWSMKGQYRTEEGGAYKIAGWMPLPDAPKE